MLIIIIKNIIVKFTLRRRHPTECYGHPQLPVLCSVLFKPALASQPCRNVPALQLQLPAPEKLKLQLVFPDLTCFCSTTTRSACSLCEYLSTFLLDWIPVYQTLFQVEVLLGATTILPCEIIGTSDRLSQITWQRTTKQKDGHFLTIRPNNEVKYSNEEDLRFEFIGNFDEKNGTLKFSNVTLKDEGSYTCIFSLLPSGKQSRTSQRVGNEEVPLATCTAAASKPKAEVKWIKGSLEGKVREELNETQHANGTTTTRSTLIGKPEREMNGQSVKCVVSSETIKEEILETNIQSHLSPNGYGLWESPVLVSVLPLICPIHLQTKLPHATSLVLHAARLLLALKLINRIGSIFQNKRFP
uniref:Ig-like domain-containing protein n=1 Tax=Oryzias melastigma TaxID=30732 RepID=A0A3B3D990_ORYME